MYHCHLLWHEDEGMMGQFVVVEEGTDPVTELPGEDHEGAGGDHDHHVGRHQH